MRIDQLSLQNFRCFEKLSLELHPQVTLLVGTNGAGKTAVLDALAIAAGAWLGGTSQSYWEDRTLQASDARLVRQEGEGQASIDAVYPVGVWASSAALPAGGTNVGAGDSLEWFRELRSARGKTTWAAAKRIRDNAHTVANRAASDAAVQLPVIAYYGTGRLWVQKKARSKKQQQKLTSRFAGYAACLEPASSQRRFERWMKTREEVRLQRMAAVLQKGEPITRVDAPHLDAVQAAVRAALPGCEHIRYDLNYDELRLTLGDSQELPFSALSDGQRSLIVLAADIAWRCVQLNPGLGGGAPDQTRGIVLIDEIELHLHPQWQRAVVVGLVESFPNLQFVITTHSPQVVSSARPEWLRVLHADGRVETVDHTRGRDANALLRDVFGVWSRPDWVRQDVARVESLLAAGNVEEAREALRCLEADLGPDDELTRGLRWELTEVEQFGPLGDDPTGEPSDA